MVFLFGSFSFTRDDLLRRMLSLLQETICFAVCFLFLGLCLLGSKKEQAIKKRHKLKRTK